MAPTYGSGERTSMKTKRILSIIGLTLLALSPTTWAAGHGGGGGGFGGGGGRGGGGFGGGHFGGGGRGGGVGFGLPAGRFGGGVPRFSGSGPGFSRGTAMSRARPHVFSGQNRGINRAAASSIARNHGTMPSAARPSRTFPQRGLNGRTDHIAERHDANWHRDWDRRHAHFFHNRFFVFDDGFWFGLDPGFYPWDYLPYYADDYYPYDYYADSQPYDNTGNNSAPVADPTVQATQTELAQLGYYKGPVDGIFGPTTRDAVAKYQTANQLDVTGSLSPDTLQSLGLPEPAAS
jgi:Putative peptidoglycan binding domain